jgi:outer membrane receptor protein involved in Fe transport
MIHLIKKLAGTSIAALLLAGILFTAATAHGQGITGTITGTVTDATGAAVPGATVTIRDTDTNNVHTVTTSDAGTYTVTQLAPGPYSVKVEKKAFKTFQQSNLVLRIDQTAQVNPALEIGAQADTIEVTSAPPVIQTEDSSIGSVIEAQAIQNTPLNGRLSIIGLIALAPGVQASGAQDQLATRGVTAAIGTGSRNAYGSLGSTLDGVTNQEITLQRGEGEVPPLDAISQFKVLTTGAPAEFNQPAQIIVASASGTNQLHGEALEYNRSKGTSAKTYNLSTAAAPARPPYERNEYGGNLNGPIVIPHIYNGRDRSFFFFAFEGFHLTQSYALSSQQPTLLERQGNFTEFLPGGICSGTNNLNAVTITNPNFTGNVINTAPNAVDQQLLNILYPLPTQAGCGTNTYEQVAELSQSTRYSVRLDHKINEKNQIRFTYLRAFYGPNHTQGSDSLQGGNSQDGEHNSNFILGYTHTFSPSLLLDVSGSYFHLPIYRTPQNVNTNFSSIIPGLGPELIEGAPQITITNITPVAESGSKDLEQAGQVDTTVTKVLAKHTLKAGFSYLYDNHWNDAAESPQRGSYAFNGHYTGIAFADFILGDPITTGNATPNNYITRNISSQYGLYVQDDWKPMPNLTLNMGLRYDLQWFKPSPYGNDSLYVPSLKEVVVFASTLPAAAATYVVANPGIPVVLAPAVGLPTNVFSYLGQDKNNIAPRFGFDYQVKPNTVVRGAFGIYYNLLPASYVGTAPFTTLPFVSAVTYSNSATATPAFTMNNPFSATGAFSANPSVLAQAKTVTPYTEEYNLAVEHQFGKGFDVRIGYVGQHNLKQNNYGGSGNYAPNLNLADPPVVGFNAQNTNLVQPFSTISLNLDPIFHSNENALQIGAHKQYSHGIAFGAEYSWTRVLGTENLEDPSGQHPSDSYGPIGGLAPQVLTVNYSYLLPFGHGQAFLGTSGNLVNKLVSGWQFSGISVFQNGQPFSVNYTAPGGVTGLVSGRANRKPGVPLYPANKTKAQWFNTSAFSAPGCLNATGAAIACPVAPFTANPASPIYATYGNSGYDMLRGPRFQDWDLSLQKNIAFKERYKLQLRADSFNAFNHPNFAVPNSNITNGNVGTITSISGTPAYEQRTVEFAVKFSF